MEASKSLRKTNRERGFTLIEILVALGIMAIGLLGLAAMVTKLTGSTEQSRYMGTEAMLASEKLEDLNRSPVSDPTISAPKGIEGSLTADATDTVTVNGVDYTVKYYDQVQISSGNGSVQEIITGVDSAGKANYSIMSHSPNGQVNSQTIAGAPPAATSDMLSFKRRWVIEEDTPVKGVRRITVSVTLQSVPTPISFQTSMVRTGSEQ